MARCAGGDGLASAPAAMAARVATAIFRGERSGVQMPDSKLVMFGKPNVGAAVMLAAPLAALDIPLKVLVWEDR